MKSLRNPNILAFQFALVLLAIAVAGCCHAHHTKTTPAVGRAEQPTLAAIRTFFDKNELKYQMAGDRALLAGFDFYGRTLITVFSVENNYVELSACIETHLPTKRLTDLADTINRHSFTPVSWEVQEQVVGITILCSEEKIGVALGDVLESAKKLMFHIEKLEGQMGETVDLKPQPQMYEHNPI